MTASLVLFPVAFIVVFASISHLTSAPFHTAFPLTNVDRAILVGELALTLAHAILPVSVVLDPFDWIDVLAFAMTEPVHHLAFVGAQIRPGVSSLASDLVLGEFSIVYGSIRPFENAAAMKKAVGDLPLVLVSVLEMTGAIAIVDLADLSVLFIVDSLSRPVLDDQLG